MSDQQERPQELHRRSCMRRFARLLRHPLTISGMTVFLGALFASQVIPWLDRGRLREEARHDLVLQIMDRHNQVKRRFNALPTALEMFHKKNGVAAHITDVSEAQKALRSQMNGLYLQFDETAWFWYDTVYGQAVHLGYSSSKMSRLKDLLEKYKDSVVKSTQMLDSFWNTCLREDYNPADPKVTKAMRTGRTELITRTEERDRMVNDIINVLSR